MYWKDKCTLLSSSSFFLCKTFRLRSSLEINWHGFTCCSRAAIIYEGLMHFKSRHLQHRQRDIANHSPFWRTTSPPAPGPHLTALPIFSLNPGLAEIFSSTSTSVLSWGPAAPKGAELQPEAAPCPDKPAWSHSLRWAQAKFRLHLRDPLSPQPIPRAPGGSGCPTPFTSQLERGAPRPAWPCKSPGLPRSPCKLWGFYFASLQSN